MSQLPPQVPYSGQLAYGNPSTSYPPSPPRRKRPRKVWFFIGATLMLLAPIIFVGAMFTILKPLTEEDAVFATGDSPVQVALPPGEERALSTDSAQMECSAVDGTGVAVEFRPIEPEFTWNQWTAVSRFDTGDGQVTFTCAGLAGAHVHVAPLPTPDRFVAGLAIGVWGPLLLGVIGLLMVIITGVLYAKGAPRDQPHATPDGENP